ncbi:hypothetical protein TNCV_651651 [Trichonephila clavipes]|nr:hypothetical protein TNCV_651651 [Trichonephila clavipes]
MTLAGKKNAKPSDLSWRPLPSKRAIESRQTNLKEQPNSRRLDQVHEPKSPQEILMKKRKCGTAPEVRRPGAPEGRGLIWLLHLQALAEQNGVAFTPWVALPGVDTPDVHRPLRPGFNRLHFAVIPFADTASTQDWNPFNWWHHLVMASTTKLNFTPRML